MVQFEIQKKKLSTVIDIVSALADESVLEFHNDRIHAEVMDPASVGMGVVDVFDGEFDSYDADGERLGVNLTRLSNIIGLAENNTDIVTVTLDEQTRKLNINVSGVNYSLALVDPDSIRDSKNPKLNPPVQVSLNESALSRAINATSMVSEAINCEVVNGKLQFQASGDTDDVDFTPDAKDIEYPDDLDADGVTATFSLEYLSEISGPMPSKEFLDFSFGDDEPLQIEFEVGDATQAKYVLAPRIQS